MINAAGILNGAAIRAEGWLLHSAHAHAHAHAHVPILLRAEPRHASA